MKILHYIPGLPPIRGGGMIKYALDLVKAQKQKNDIFLLIPGAISLKKYKRVNVSVDVQKVWNGIPVYQIRNPLPIPMANGIQDIEWYSMTCNGVEYAKFLKLLCPDIIHIHSLMGLHAEFLEAAVELGIPTIYTTHDYFGICPKTDLMCGNGICNRPGKECGICCQNAFNEKRLLLEQSSIYAIYRSSNFLIKLFGGELLQRYFPSLRSHSPVPYEKSLADDRTNTKSATETMKHYWQLLAYYKKMFGRITFFHFNSNLARMNYERYLGILKGQVLSISNQNIHDCRRIHRASERIRVGFLGGDSPYKGLTQLKSALQALYDKGLSNIELHIYGSREYDEYNFCYYHNAFKPEQIEQVFDQMDLLAVPSSWPETFGMVVLEAISFGVPVILTEQVGAKDIFQTSSLPLGIMIPSNESALQGALMEVCQHKEIIESLSRNICQADLKLNFEYHVAGIMQMYREV